MQKETKTQSARRQYDEHIAVATGLDFSLSRRVEAAQEAMWFARYCDLELSKRDEAFDVAHELFHKLSEMLNNTMDSP